MLEGEFLLAKRLLFFLFGCFLLNFFLEWNKKLLIWVLKLSLLVESFTDFFLTLKCEISTLGWLWVELCW